MTQNKNTSILKLDSILTKLGEMTPLIIILENQNNSHVINDVKICFHTIYLTPNEGFGYGAFWREIGESKINYKSSKGTSF